MARHLQTFLPVALAGLCMSCSVTPNAPQKSTAPTSPPAATGSACTPLYPVAPEDERFLDDLEHRIFLYFWNEVFPETGIAIDHTQNRIGKVAATGFELAALPVGVQRGWITRDQGYQRALLILKRFWRDPADPEHTGVDGHFGLFWHFVDGKTGKLMPMDCVACCDSADFIAGAVVIGEYFKGTEVETLARKIVNAPEWDKFVAKKPDGKPGLMSFGWVPLHVSKSYYDTDGLLNFNMSGLVDNSLLIYVLALGSETFPIPQETWDEYVKSYTLDEYAGYECVFAGALFCRQVPQSFIRFSRKRDRKIDYFLDTVNALLADRAFNMRVNGYPPQLWGLTDCFGKNTYSHAAPPGPIANDGTVGSTAFVGALPHVPGLSLEAMRFVRSQFGDRAYGQYGFTSSVDLKNDFASPLYVGIELGPMIMMIENFRSGLIWDLFSSSPVMKNFVRRARMSGVVDDFELPPEAPPYATWKAEGAAAVVGHDEPQSGKKCLEFRDAGKEITIIGRLTENDLLEFDFGRYLSLWVRDLRPTRVSITLDGRDVILESAGQLQGNGWQNCCYELPPHESTSKLCGVQLTAEVTGSRPALDNIALYRNADLGAPGPILDLHAQTGELGGTVDLRWTSPTCSGGTRLGRYLVSVTDSSSPEHTLTLELLANTGPNEPETQSVCLERGRRYSFRIMAEDEHGHCGPSSAPAEAIANSNEIKRVAYDFENWNVGGWATSTTNIRLSVVSDGGTGKCLRVDYRKDNGWNFMLVDVDADAIALHRYICMSVRGKVELLGKAWCKEGLEQDIYVEHADSDSTWTEFKFDTRKATALLPRGAAIHKLILFVQPGKWEGSGTFYIDNVRYAD